METINNTPEVTQHSLACRFLPSGTNPFKNKTMYTLETLRELAYRSFSGTSFSPEKRAESIVRDYSQELNEDLLIFKAMGADATQLERYKAGYIKHLSAWLASHSNVMSSMITGPANFPVAKNRKRSDWADNHYNVFRLWRTKVHKAYERYEKKQRVIDAGGELAIAKKKLANCLLLQESMKAVNAEYKKYKKNPNSLAQSTLSPAEIEKVVTWFPKYEYEKQPYKQFQLTNNNAVIKHTQKRVAELESKESKAELGNKEIVFPGGVCILNYKEDRIQLRHAEKPDSNVIAEIKSCGFRWSPFHKVWQRQITNNALYVTKTFLKINVS